MNAHTVRDIIDRPEHPAHTLTKDDRQSIIEDLVASGKRLPTVSGNYDGGASSNIEKQAERLAGQFNNKYGIKPTLDEIFIAAAQHFDQETKELNLLDPGLIKSGKVSSKIRMFHAFIAHKFYGFSFNDITEATGQTDHDVGQAYERLTTALTSRQRGAYIETDIIAIAAILRNHDRSFLNLPAPQTAEQIRTAKNGRLVDTPYVANLRTTNQNLYNNIKTNLPEMQAGSFAALFVYEYGHGFQPDSVLALLALPGFNRLRDPRSLTTYNGLALLFLERLSAPESPGPNIQAARKRVIPARQADAAEHR